MNGNRMIFFKKKSPEKPMAQQTLTDIIRGLQYAASTTSQTVAQQHLALLGRFFTKDKDDHLHAEMVSMKLGENHSIKVPLISLAHTQGLALSEMKVKLAVRLQQQEAKEMKTNIENSLDQTRSAFSVSVKCKKKKNDEVSSEFINLELIFKNCEIPEGLNRIIEEYSLLIRPELIQEKPIPSRHGERDEGEGKENSQ